MTIFISHDTSAVTALLVWGALHIALTYDIFCHWFPGFKVRVKELPPPISFDAETVDLNGGIPRFHAPGHNESCRVRYSLNYKRFIGRIDGEGCERAWAYLNETAGSTSEKSPGARGDSINFIVQDLNFGKVVTSANLTKPKKMYKLQLGVFTELDGAMPLADTAKWRLESTEPKKVRGAWTSVFFGNNDWGKGVREVLQEENCEAADSSAGEDNETSTEQDCNDTQGGTVNKRDSLVRWLSKAIELENSQDKLRVDASQLKANSTPRQHNLINNRRTLLIPRVAALRQERECFMGSLGDPDHPTRDQFQSPDIEYAEFGLLSAYQSSTLVAENCLVPPRAEGSLRRAACDDDLKIVRNLLGAKSLAIRYKRKNLTGERATTRAESLIKALRDKVESARRRYNRSRDALLRLDLLGSDHRTYRVLEQGDLTMLSEYLDNESSAIGQGSRNISWIWRSEVVSNDESWMIAALKVEWFRARQRAIQWEEELILLKREIVMTLKTFQYEQQKWEKMSMQPALHPGMREYALRKSRFFGQLAYDAHLHGNRVVS
ncbi:hypothetical protein FRC06_003144, partial [Ceratobasidium sp. 370]